LWSYKNRPVGWDYDLILECHAMDSWIELPKATQKSWKEEIRKLRSQHGFRTDEDYMVPVMPDTDILVKALKTRVTRSTRREAENSEQAKEIAKLWDSRFGEWVKSAFCSGQAIIVFDPLLPDVERILKDRVQRLLCELRKSVPKAFCNSAKIPTIGRARIEEWLSVIEAFEKVELAADRRVKRNDQLFARYRRIIKSWKF